MGISSCNKDQEIFTPDEIKGDASIFFESVQPEPIYQEEIDPFTAQEIYLESGVRLTIPAESIVDNAGLLPEGKINLEFSDNIHISDYILKGIETIVDGEIQNFVNTINISMFDGTKFYQFEEGSDVVISIPMELSDYDKSSLVAKVSGSESNDWSFVEAGSAELDKWYDNWSYNGMNYEGISLKGAIPTDFAVSIPLSGDGSIQLQPCLTLPETFTSKNTKVLMVLDQSNTVIPMTSTNSSIFCVENVKVLQGQKIDIIVISSWNEDEYYFGRVDGFASEKTNLVLVPELTSKFEILDILAMF